MPDVPEVEASPEEDEPEREFNLAMIRQQVQEEHYSIRSHTVDHMVKEGFDEPHVLQTVLTGQVLEEYLSACRCLIFGFFDLSPDVTLPLHVVVDYVDPERVDIVTAYIPGKPEWQTPTQRAERKGRKKKK